MVGAVGEGVGVGHVALAAGGVCADGGPVRCECIAACIGDGRDMRRRDDGIRQTADSVETVGCGYDKVFWHDMIGVVPCVIRAVDSVGVDEGGVAASV